MNVSIYDLSDEAITRYYSYQLLPDKSNTIQLKNFKNSINGINHYGSNLFDNESITKMNTKNDIIEGNTLEEKSVHIEIIEDSMMEVIFLNRLETQEIHGELMTTTRDQFTFAVDV